MHTSALLWCELNAATPNGGQNDSSCDNCDERKNDAVDDSLIELQQAPSAEGLALLNGHKF